MATFIVLGNFTEQGLRAVKQTTKRAEAAQAAAKEVGVTMREIFWTQGQYDMVSIVEAPDEAALTAFGLTLAGAGNVRTQTLRAFTKGEMEKILTKVA
ncbi:GYD domain-containing protein [Piscinibacter sp. XHJ-5]|uniref:GYD domain-containing protein n=1 Tax=Piscinibacter sp. XHJ-5 TaxID=3037797 RepID=UPI002452E3CC|nr:GYD domain-containing protein [Piscinibacter sp. XHJ-5]